MVEDGRPLDRLEIGDESSGVERTQVNDRTGEQTVFVGKSDKVNQQPNQEIRRKGNNVGKLVRAV